MKRAVVLLMSVAAISCAQDRKPESNKAPQSAQEKKRLQSVTWDLKSHKLVWVVERGADRGGQFVPSTSDRYEISPDDAVMAFANEKRGFTEEEAASLHKLLDTLSLYCAESVVWWDQGEGVPLDGQGHPKDQQKPKAKEPEPKRERVDQQPTPAKRGPKLLVAHAVVE